MPTGDPDLSGLEWNDATGWRPRGDYSVRITRAYGDAVLKNPTKEPSMAYTAEDFDAFAERNKESVYDVPLINAALRIAALVTKPGVIEEEVHGDRDIADAIRKSLTEE